ARAAAGEGGTELLGRVQQRAHEPDCEQAPGQLEGETDQHHWLERGQPGDPALVRELLDVLLEQEAERGERGQPPGRQRVHPLGAEGREYATPENRGRQQHGDGEERQRVVLQHLREQAVTRVLRIEQLRDQRV